MLVEEKVDEHSHYGSSCNDAMQDQEHRSFCTLLSELSTFLSERELQVKKNKLDVSEEAERLLRDSAANLSATRPPNNFVVYNGEGPSTFDGAVANATPTPLGGAATGGASTILHLACALDVPLALAFLLAMGADARASHTAFRRLMIHEAACNGSIHCLALLLELGHKFGDGVASKDMHLPFVPRRIDRSHAGPPLHLCAAYPELFAGGFQSGSYSGTGTDFITLLGLFRNLARQVKQRELTELDAARRLMDHASLCETSKVSLARSCGYSRDHVIHRNLFRTTGGLSDGHGNTPLHWAAFKNETGCVALLLKYHADPNARAHPSGWTPLHDAAYSNSRNTIEQLLDAGAEVDARANSGATPLCFAAQEDAAEAAELLLQRGADLAARCAGGPIRDDGTVQPGHHSRFSGYTPLHYCAHYNAFKAARVLLRHTAAMRALNIPDLSDRLAIHVAVARGSSDVLREMLHAGVRIQTRLQDHDSPTLRRTPPSPETPSTPPRRGSPSPTLALTPVSSPLLRSMIPSHPVTSSKPWNCLSQESIDECRELLSQAELHWSIERHALFTPADRAAVMELLKVGNRLEKTHGIFLDLWPAVLSYCGRGWFDPELTRNEQDLVVMDEGGDETPTILMSMNDRELSLPRLM